MLTTALLGLETEAFLYVNDIIIFCCSLKHHNTNLIKVLHRLKKFNLKLNPNKCCFKTRSLISWTFNYTKRYKTRPWKFWNKKKNIEKYKNTDDVRRYIAICNYYRRFIANFAQIANWLNQFLKKGNKFKWTDEH